MQKVSFATRTPNDKGGVYFGSLTRFSSPPELWMWYKKLNVLDDLLGIFQNVFIMFSPWNHRRWSQYFVSWVVGKFSKSGSFSLLKHRVVRIKMVTDLSPLWTEYEWRGEASNHIFHSLWNCPYFPLKRIENALVRDSNKTIMAIRK